MSNRPTNALTALRQLACLRLPGKSVIPEIFTLLRGMAGYESGQGVFLDSQCRIADVYFRPEVPPEYIQELAQYFEANPTGDGTVVTAATAMAQGYRVLRHSQLVAPRIMWNSEFYARFGRRYDVGWVAQIHLRDGEKPLATLSLARPQSMKDFTRAEEIWLTRAEPWLSHALAPVDWLEPRAAEPDWPTDELGMLVLSERGDILYASPGAMILMQQAAGATALGRQKDNDAVARLSKRIAEAVAATRQGREGLLPSLSIANQAGRFRLRGYQLHAVSAGQAPQVSLHIERRVPVSLRLFSSQRFLALSTRERDVCLHLVAGHSIPRIAGELGVKPSSVIHHTRSLYNRLGISGQKEVVEALLGSAGD